MGLKRIIFGLTADLLLWLMPGCSDSPVSAPSVWGGMAEVSADRAEIRNVRWKEIPSWEEWATLPQKSQIIIQGEWQIAGEPAPVSFQCRLVRQSDTLYKLNFTGGEADRVFTAVGDFDWVRHSAALDFQGRFAAEQYRKYWGTRPALRQGAAKVSGSLLVSAERISFPRLTVVPVEKSILQIGCMELTGGRMERRETFSGKLEFVMFGMTARAGGMKLRPNEVIVDRDQAVVKTKVEPDHPWQSSVALTGEMRCSLADAGEWSLVAELPEAGVFRYGDLILPLRSCRVSGNGDQQSGKWSFLGEGASGSLQQSGGNITASNVLLRGSKSFLWAERKTGFLPDTFQVECGRIEFPYQHGRISAVQLKGDFQPLPAGGLQFTGSAGEVVFSRKDGGIRIGEPAWNLPLLHVGGKFFSAESGQFRAKKLSLSGDKWNAVLEKIQSSVTLKEHSWDMTVMPEVMRVASGMVSVSLKGAVLKVAGGRSSSGWVEVSGNGKSASGNIMEWAGEGGAWDFHGGFSADFSRCNFMTLSGSAWQGKCKPAGTWNVAKIALQADRKKNNTWLGKIDLEGGSMACQGGEINGFSGTLPFGGADAVGGRITADLIRYQALSVNGLALELQNSADGISLRGRGRIGLTGGACFVTGDIRTDLRQGIVEYSMPAATLLKELKVSELLPLSGGWIFSGKLGGSGKIFWKNAIPAWQRKYTFTGFARNASCMVEDLSGQIEPADGEIADGRLLFGRLTTVAGECSAGELHFRTGKGNMILQDARFEAWGGYWKYIRNGEFQVKGIQPGGLLTLQGWQKAIQGKFSGNVTLDSAGNIRLCDLKSDGAGTLDLTDLEKYQLVPKKEFDMNALAFTTAVFRDFRFNSLALRVIRRKSNVLLRVTGEGRPGKAVPFMLEKDGLFRNAVGEEPGFDGNVEVGCGYRIPLRDLGPQTGNQ